MIIKKLLNNIEINKFTLIFILICLLTGLFKELLAISILLIFHEFGHYFVAKFFKWNVKKIVFYPFGGITIFDEKIDNPLYQEFLITIFGPIFQLIIFSIFYYLNKKYIISDYFFSLIKNYNVGILLLNCLPIIPLDGSKILNIILNKFISFRKSYILTIFFSLLFLLVFVYIIKNDNSYYMIIAFLLYQIIIKIKYKNYIFNRFILEKKIYKNNYKKYKKIRDIKNMFRNKKHLIFLKNNYVTEKNFFIHKK